MEDGPKLKRCAFTFIRQIRVDSSYKKYNLALPSSWPCLAWSCLHTGPRNQIQIYYYLLLSIRISWLLSISKHFMKHPHSLFTWGKMLLSGSTVSSRMSLAWLSSPATPARQAANDNSGGNSQSSNSSNSLAKTQLLRSASWVVTKKLNSVISSSSLTVGFKVSAKFQNALYSLLWF